MSFPGILATGPMVPATAATQAPSLFGLQGPQNQTQQILSQVDQFLEQAAPFAANLADRFAQAGQPMGGGQLVNAIVPPSPQMRNPGLDSLTAMMGLFSRPIDGGIRLG